MTTNEDHLQDDLEKRIDEAEMEAQIEENKTENESSFEEEVTESIKETQVEQKKPSKARLIFRRILVWLVVIAIAFAAGFFVDSVLRYQPEQVKVERLTTELEDARIEITALEAEISRLSEFEEKNLTLEENITKATIHLTLLSARAAVADASLALEQDRTADAKLALDKVGSTLESLKSLVTEDQAEVVETMIQRHNLIVNELNDDGFSAQTDLVVLAGKLNSLENTLFATP